MRIQAFFGRLAPCAGAICALTALGCGSDGGSAVCDINFSSIAGTYSFAWTTHDVRYSNSCFDNFTDPQPPDPGTLTGCTWNDSTEDETVTIELVIEEDGDIGNAKIISVKGEGVDDEASSLGLKCELLEGAVCDAPIRCSITGETCGAPTISDPDEWQYGCNCAAGSPNDPAGAACQQCKTEYDKYTTERLEYCQKGKDGDYFEFTLHVK